MAQTQEGVRGNSAFFIAALDPLTRHPQCVCWAPGADDVAPGLPPPRNLLPFLFPDAQPADWHPREYLAPTTHCFTLTGADGSTRLHGFCRTSLPPALAGPAGPRRRLPRVLCVLSPHLWPAFFFKALEAVDKLLAAEPRTAAGLPAVLPPASAAADVLRQLAAAAGPRPIPGSVAVLHWPPYLIVDLAPARTADGDVLRGGGGILELEVPDFVSSPGAGVPPARLFVYMTPRQAVTVLEALLLERRVVFASADPGRAALAVHAAAALLHPFPLHHIYLPLLPRGLADYLHAPVPLLGGAATGTLAAGGAEALQGVLVVDLDRPGTCSPAVGGLQDDALRLPRAEALAAALATATAGLRGADDPSPAPQIFQALGIWYDDVILGGMEGFIEDASSVAAAGADGAFVEHGLALNWPSFLETHRLREDGEARALFLESFRHSQMLEVAVRAALRERARGACDAPGEAAGPDSVRLEVGQKVSATEVPLLIDFAAASPPWQQGAGSSAKAPVLPVPRPPAAFLGWTTFEGAEWSPRPVLSPLPPAAAPAAAAAAAPPPAGPGAQGPLQQGLPLLASPAHRVLPMSPLRQGATGAGAVRVGRGGAGGDSRRAPEAAGEVEDDVGVARTAQPAGAAAVAARGEGGSRIPFLGWFWRL